MEEIPVSLIEHSEIRLNADYAVDDLVESFKVQGQLSPIKVRPLKDFKGRYEVIFGNRRLKAATLLGWEKIKADVIEATDWEKLRIALSENLDRRNFSDYEISLLIEKLHSTTGKTYGEIAALINRSNAFVSQHVSMLGLFQEGIASKEERSKVLNSLSERHARILAGIEDQLERWNTAKLAVAASLGLRELQRLASHHVVRKRSIESSQGKRVLVNLINDIVKGVSTKDLRPLFESRSSRSYSLFSMFPPSLKLTRESAKDHLCNLIKESGRYRVSVRDLDLKMHGNFAYATMYVTHEISYNGRVMRNRSRATMIFAKEDNTWKILHEHFSPVDIGEMRDFFDHLEQLNRPFAFRISNPRQYR